MAPSDQTHGARHLSMMRSLGLTQFEAECEISARNAAYLFEAEMYAYYVHRDQALLFLEARRRGRDVSGMVVGPAAVKLAQQALNNAIGFASR